MSIHTCGPECTWRNCADQERAHDSCRKGVVSCEACDYLSSQDPQDASDRLAHGLRAHASRDLLGEGGPL